jgi:hypothetical protein
MLNLSKRFIDGNYDVSEYRWCYDRAAQGAASGAAKTAAGTAATEQGNANAAGAALTPFYRYEMNAQHGFNPQQQQELLNAQAAPLAGSAATAAGQARSEAARTRNTSGFSAGLDEAARMRNAAMGQAGADVASADVMGAKQLNQAGAAGMAGLYNTDTDAMLKAMGIQTGDINAQTEAGKSGWFQNLTSGIDAGANLISALKKPFGGNQGGGN